jgi:hypothetical protein
LTPRAGGQAEADRVVDGSTGWKIQPGSACWRRTIAAMSRQTAAIR